MNLSIPPSFRFYLTLLTLVAAFSNLTLGQSSQVEVSDTKPGLAQPEASVVSITFNGLIDCADLNASTNTAFSHIIDNYELKLDFGEPNGSFAFAPAPGVSIIGPQYPSRFLTVSSSGSTVHSWSSQILITAVIMKVGNQSVVYPYKPFASRDVDLITGVQQSISHLAFCYADSIAPTAGDGSISGRVTTSFGRAISGARLTLVDAASGETATALTNSFGYYTVDNVQVGRFYILNVAHKRYRFASPSQTISLMDSLTGIDFVANP